MASAIEAFQEGRAPEAASPSAGRSRAPIFDEVAEMRAQADLLAESVRVKKLQRDNQHLDQEAEAQEEAETQRRDESERKLNQQQSALNAMKERQAAERTASIAKKKQAARRREWYADWQKSALALLNAGPHATTQTRSALVLAVKSILDRLTPDADDDATLQLLIEKAVDDVTAPLRRDADIEKLFAQSEGSLPGGARSYLTPSEWQLRFRQDARAAVRRLGVDAAIPEIRAAVEAVARSVAQNFEAEEDSKRRALDVEIAAARRRNKAASDANVLLLRVVDPYLKTLSENAGNGEYYGGDFGKHCGKIVELHNRILPELVQAHIETDIQSWSDQERVEFVQSLIREKLGAASE